jgi:hypothetical protein
MNTTIKFRIVIRRFRGMRNVAEIVHKVVYTVISCLLLNVQNCQLQNSKENSFLITITYIIIILKADR